MANRSVGMVLDESRGLGQGFDFLRVTLAFGVVAWHTPEIAAALRTHINSRFLWLFDFSILEMFFGLSGFLIAGSALRLSLSNFLINRGLRIFPALLVEIALSAGVIGYAFTTLPKTKYLIDPLTLQYLGNCIGLIHYKLPGVFEHNPSYAMNGSLWTVPYELGCYAIMAVFMISGALKRPWLVTAVAVVISATGLAMFFSGYRGPPHGHVQALFDHVAYGRGARLFMFFILGISAYLARYKIPYSTRGLVLALGGYLLIAGLGHRHYAEPLVDLVTALPVTYLMVYAGCSKLPQIPFFHRGDYSYGIYLYGWPVMQVVRTLIPSLGSHVLMLWLVSVVPITLFAMFSWHVIEKPIIRLRRKFSFVARQRLAESGPSPALAGGAYDRPIIREERDQKV